MMKESSQFVLDILIRDQKNRLVTSPSYSPENNYVDPVTGKGSKLTYAPTMDMEIINDLFIRTSAAKILHQDVKFADTLSNTMKQLVPVQLAKDGSIQEWVEDYKETEPGYRHVSHLFALHPGDQITPLKTPELFEGARKTLAKCLKMGERVRDGAGLGPSISLSALKTEMQLTNTSLPCSKKALHQTCLICILLSRSMATLAILLALPRCYCKVRKGRLETVPSNYCRRFRLSGQQEV